MRIPFATSLALYAWLTLASPAQAQLQCSGLASGPTIKGLYVDNYGGWHSVGREAWLSFTGEAQQIFHSCSIDANRHFLIAQNSPGNDFNAGKYSRFEWYEANGQLAYCQQVFDAASAADAADLAKYPAAAVTDVNDAGCGAGGKFPWTVLAPVQR